MREPASSRNWEVALEAGRLETVFASIVFPVVEFVTTVYEGGIPFV
jgi:hypothetical protein